MTGTTTSAATAPAVAPGLMAVHAHPDDECISTGGALLDAAARGLRTAVVTCTGGERGEIVGEGMDPDAVRPRLAEVRLAELTEALSVLGAGPPRMLGYVDSGMVGTDGNDDPASFWRARFDDAVERLVRQVRAFRPDVLVTYDAYGLYGHPDHVQAHRVTLVAAEAAGVPRLYPGAGAAWRPRKAYLATIPQSLTRRVNEELAARDLPSPFAADADVPPGTPDALVTTVVDVTAHLPAKLRALRAHRSQVGPGSFFLNMPDDMVDAAFGAEWYVRLRSDVPVPDPETDLFAGLLTGDAGERAGEQAGGGAGRSR